MKFEGLYTAIITPFRDGKVDETALQKLVESQIEGGVAGLVPVGTTGESPTLSIDEHLGVIASTVKYAAGRVQVIAGTGANCTQEAIELTKEAEKLGADATLQVCPYYNKPSQEGLYQHFSAIANASKLPIMLYSIPGRSVIEIALDTIVRLAKDFPTIVAVKEAGGNVDRVNQLIQLVPEGFSILSGDDGLTLPFMACGASGLVSVTANIAPAEMNSLVASCLEGDYTLALEIQKKLYPLMKTLMSLDTNPVPIKEAVAMLGYMTNEIRLPMVNLSDEKRAEVAAILKQYELI